MNIAFVDLQRQYRSIRQEIHEAINRVVERQVFILGEEGEAFEKEFAEYLGAKYVVGVGNGTDALTFGLRALGVEAGDEVITTTHSFIATALAVAELGAKPIFVDCDPNTYQIDATQIEAKITEKTKAILPVHLYGAPADMVRIMEISKKHNIPVIEDACQAHGAMVGDKKVGTFGALGAFSFYPGKNLGGYGDGGAICTDDEEIYQKMLLLRNYGQRVKYYHDEIGKNSRLDEIQAAILRVKLPYLDRWNAQRTQIAQWYKQRLPKRIFQEIIPGTTSIFHLLLIQDDERERTMQRLTDAGVHSLIHYPVPIHLQKCYDYMGYKEGDFPASERITKKIISLPMFSELKEEEVEFICQTLEQPNQ